MRLTAAAAPAPTASTRRSLRSPRGRAAMAGLAVALLAAGCGNGSGGSAGGPVSGTVTIAAVPGVDNAPLFLAQHDGLFQAAGLNVDIKTYTSVTAEVQDLISGRVDIAAGDYGPFLYSESLSKSVGIKIVSDGYDATAGVLEVLTLPSSGINTPEQLGNTRIGTPKRRPSSPRSTRPSSISMTAISSKEPSSRSTGTRSCSTSVTRPKASSPPESCRSSTTLIRMTSSRPASISRPLSCRRRTRKAG